MKRALEIVQLYRSGVIESIEPGGIRFGAAPAGLADLARAFAAASQGARR